MLAAILVSEWIRFVPTHLVRVVSLCIYMTKQLFLMRESVQNGVVSLLARFHCKTRREDRQRVIIIINKEDL